MFRQFAIARFMIGFIVFILTYMVAVLSYDKFFQLITAGLFVLTLYILREMNAGHREELEKKDQLHAEKTAALEDELRKKDLHLQKIIHAITINREES
jgi:predicted lysophospholipase L1 biosynthesis ABC-type transport system permease subunit